MIVRRNGDWLTARIGEESVMMSAADGVYLGLNDVATRIWELIETPVEFDALCETLVQEFEVEPEACRTEVRALFDDLERRGVATLE